MKVKSLGKNQTEITQKNWKVFISYETPVAAIHSHNNKWTGFRTKEFHSQTTSKHINQWFQKYEDSILEYEERKQDFFDKLLD